MGPTQTYLHHYQTKQCYDQIDQYRKVTPCVRGVIAGAKYYPDLDDEILDYLNSTLTIDEFNNAFEVYKIFNSHEYEKSSLDELFK